MHDDPSRNRDEAGLDAAGSGWRVRPPAHPVAAQAAGPGAGRETGVATKSPEGRDPAGLTERLAAASARRARRVLAIRVEIDGSRRRGRGLRRGLARLPAMDGIRAGGSLAAFVGSGPVPLRGIRVVPLNIHAGGAALTGLSALATARKLTLRVAGTYPLQDAARADERLKPAEYADPASPHPMST